MRLMLWLGLEKDEDNWKECSGAREVAVYAETVCYYNVMYTYTIGACSWLLAFEMFVGWYIPIQVHFLLTNVSQLL